jgi:hypothetical protein
MITFVPTHTFVLDDDTRVYVRVELRGDYIAEEADGTSWYTVVGHMDPWWSCRMRGIRRVKRVEVVRYDTHRDI